MEQTPWYRQFWPWLLILLPGSVVVAAFITLFIAINHDDSMVLDDYYKEGLAINRELALDQFALEQAMSGLLSYQPDTQQITITLNELAEPTRFLELKLAHPTDAVRDQTLRLMIDGAGHYIGRAEQPLNGRWYVQLSDAVDAPPQWRLRGILQIDDVNLTATLNAG